MSKEQIQRNLDEAAKIREKLPFDPLDDSLIVYRLTVSQTAGGIMLPSDASVAAAGTATSAVVLAAGPGKHPELGGDRVPMNVEVGDYILISSLAGLGLGEVVRAEMKDLGSFEEMRLIRQKDVIARLKPDYLDGAS